MKIRVNEKFENNLMKNGNINISMTEGVKTIRSRGVGQFLEDITFDNDKQDEIHSASHFGVIYQ